MRYDLVERGLIPLDKSWMIRMGVLDLFNDYGDCADFLQQNHDVLSDDLQALGRASTQWASGRPIDVGESATLYRFLRFASWKLRQDKEFAMQGTLNKRKIYDDPEIVGWPLEKLLTLDNGTSQWASASVLAGNQQRIPKPPYKLQLTYDAVEHWKSARSSGKVWEPRYDETILEQASAYLQWIIEGRMDFVPKQSEDYCFSRAFGIMTAVEGEKRWPSLRGHESDRIDEMEEAIQQTEIISRDHRVVQAIAMSKRGGVVFRHPYAVKKSWPQFWKFLEAAPSLAAA